MIGFTHLLLYLPKCTSEVNVWLANSIPIFCMVDSAGGAASSTAETCSWAIPASTMMRVFKDAFNDKVNTEFMHTIKHVYKGPAMYLRKQFEELEQQNEFAKLLTDEFPERDDLYYHHDRDMPT